MDKLFQRVLSLVLVAVLALAVFAGYRLAREYARAEVYRTRLQELMREHEALREQYNRAVKKTAITELLIEGGKLSVVVATEEHELRRIDTPFDPSSEIHVDFVVIDGRLWIRRIHDSNTPASQAQLIDPALAEVDWNASAANHGLTIYRPLGEGRWIVSVSGNGALTLQQAEPKARVPLAASGIALGDFEEMERDASQRADDIGILDTLKALLFSSEPPQPAS